MIQLYSPTTLNTGSTLLLFENFAQRETSGPKSTSLPESTGKEEVAYQPISGGAESASLLLTSESGASSLCPLCFWSRPFLWGPRTSECARGGIEQRKKREGVRKSGVVPRWGERQLFNVPFLSSLFFICSFWWRSTGVVCHGKSHSMAKRLSLWSSSPFMDQLPLKEQVYTINGIIHDLSLKMKSFFSSDLGSVLKWYIMD